MGRAAVARQHSTHEQEHQENKPLLDIRPRIREKGAQHKAQRAEEPEEGVLGGKVSSRRHGALIGAVSIFAARVVLWARVDKQ